jgi:uncharacterized protein (DUF2236 family)
MPLTAPSSILSRTLVSQVRATFNDRSKGEQPIAPSDDALFPRGSMIWRVHGDVTSMMVGGVASLLTQMLHPAALAGVWDHSNARADQLGRLRRTARFIAVTTYGERDAAQAAIARVRAIHAQVGGKLPSGQPYQAGDPWLLAWVHVAGAVNFLDAWRRYVQPRASRAEQDRYFAESGDVAALLGADPVPRTRADAENLLQQFRPELCSDARTHEFRKFVLEARSASLAEVPVQKLLMSAAVDLMPQFARAMHGLRRPLIPVRAPTFALASTLRWAFAVENYR